MRARALRTAASAAVLMLLTSLTSAEAATGTACGKPAKLCASGYQCIKNECVKAGGSERNIYGCLDGQRFVSSDGGVHWHGLTSGCKIRDIPIRD
jgi:hypothetical protein